MTRTGSRSEILERLEHGHVFLGAAHARNERRVRAVVALTLVMMVGEIVAGSVFGSMALLADGWHMATHAGALSISALAYAFARRRAHDPRYVFGTGKVGDLAGFTSAVILAGIAVLIGVESFQRLLHPTAIRFDDAILVAVLGLAVNCASAYLLGSEHDHEPHGGHAAGAHEHDSSHHDHNLRSAYYHVLADALTSIFAIAALCAGKYLDWTWMDALSGVLGALVILRWSIGLLKDSGAVLLDFEPDASLARSIRTLLEHDERTVIADLHVWRVGPGSCAAIVSLASTEPQSPQHYRERLEGLEQLVHVTIEVHAAEESDRLEAASA